MERENELVYFSFADGKKSELMDFETSKLFQRELNKVGVGYEVKSISVPSGMINHMKSIDKINEELTVENFEIKKDIKGIVVELQSLKDIVESINKKVNNY